MKKILPGACLLLMTKILAAQTPYITIDTVDRKVIIPGVTKNSLLTERNFSHSTLKGKVYILPYDNMPCLVPDMQQVTPMPGSIQKLPESKMPNAMPRRRIIPEIKKP